nr:restriction endonuclease [Rhodopirellula sp. SM50]
MRHRYQMPGNEDEFEEFCVRYFKVVLERPALTRYGKRGEQQDGIDIIDVTNQKPLFAVQCKHHEPQKSIPPKEIKDEVAKIGGSAHEIDHVIIATTAKRSRNAQDTVLDLNKKSYRFKIEVQFWEDICANLDQRPELAQQLWGSSESRENSVAEDWLGKLPADISKSLVSLDLTTAPPVSEHIGKSTDGKFWLVLWDCTRCRYKIDQVSEDYAARSLEPVRKYRNLDAWQDLFETD